MSPKIGPFFNDILNPDLSLTNLIYQRIFDHRREEKLYVEGMEDEDMKKETQNLAYPPAFKVTTDFHKWVGEPLCPPLSTYLFEAGGCSVCEEAQPVCRRQDLQRGKTKDF